jgi:hypothetical protein
MKSATALMKDFMMTQGNRDATWLLPVAGRRAKMNVEEVRLMMVERLTRAVLKKSR